MTMKRLLQLYKNWFGEIQYIVTILSVSGEVSRIKFTNSGDLHKFVCNCNDERYWCVQKIEKIREYEFTYSNTVIHTPLFFSLPDVTEQGIIRETSYSFPVQDKSLVNVIRVERN